MMKRYLTSTVLLLVMGFALSACDDSRNSGSTSTAAGSISSVFASIFGTSSETNDPAIISAGDASTASVTTNPIEVN